MNYLNLFRIGVDSFNIFSLMAGMFIAALLGFQSRVYSLVIVVIYLACMCVYFYTGGRL